MLLLQEQLGSDVKVDALLYAAPNVGDAEFAAGFGVKVNARRLSFIYDLVPQLPCAPTIVGCKDALVPTPSPSKDGLWSYTSIPGNLMLMPEGMPQQQDAWALFNAIYPCEANRFMQATHGCSYMCYLTQYVADPHSKCQLWTPTGNSTDGSECYDTPIADGPQYPYAPS